MGGKVYTKCTCQNVFSFKVIFYASYMNGKEIICIPSFSGYDSFLLMRVLMTVRYSLGYYIKLGWIFAVFGKKDI